MKSPVPSSGEQAAESRVGPFNLLGPQTEKEEEAGERKREGGRTAVGQQSKDVT